MSSKVQSEVVDAGPVDLAELASRLDVSAQLPRWRSTASGLRLFFIICCVNFGAHFIGAIAAFAEEESLQTYAMALTYRWFVGIVLAVFLVISGVKLARVPRQLKAGPVAFVLLGLCLFQLWLAIQLIGITISGVGSVLLTQEALFELHRFQAYDGLATLGLVGGVIFLLLRVGSVCREPSLIRRAVVVLLLILVATACFGVGLGALEGRAAQICIGVGVAVSLWNAVIFLGATNDAHYAILRLPGVDAVKRD